MIKLCKFCRSKLMALIATGQAVGVEPDHYAQAFIRTAAAAGWTLPELLEVVTVLATRTDTPAPFRYGPAGLPTLDLVPPAPPPPSNRAN